VGTSAGKLAGIILFVYFEMHGHTERAVFGSDTPSPCKFF
jgi:hypothetical protein